MSEQWFQYRATDPIDKDFNVEEFVIPDEDYAPLLTTIHNTPIPNILRLQKKHSYFPHFIEPARKGNYYVDRIEDELLVGSKFSSNAHKPDANLRILTWPSRRVVLKSNELPKIIKNLMDTESEWDAVRGWIIPGVNEQNSLISAVVNGLRVRYLGIKTSIVQNTLKMKGYLEKPSVTKGAMKRKLPVPGKLTTGFGGGGDSDDDNSPRAKNHRVATNAFFRRELNTRGGPMPNEVYNKLMKALDNREGTQFGVPRDVLESYEKVWIVRNKYGLPEVDHTKSGDGGTWGIYHHETNRIVVKEAECLGLVDACQQMGYKGRKAIFDFVRDKFCVSRDRIHDFIETPSPGGAGDEDQADEAAVDNRRDVTPAPARPQRPAPTPRRKPPPSRQANHHHSTGGGSGGKGKGKRRIRVSVVYEHSGYVANSSEDEWMEQRRVTTSPNMARYPMQFVQIECVPTQSANYSSKTYAFVLVVRCTFSGYVFARAIPDTDRGLLCRHLMDIFGNFGPPKGYYSGATDARVIKDCVTDVEQLFRVEIQNMGKEPPKTPRTLMTTFRDRCYEKAKESFGDIRRWVEILPYTVMEFNQRVQIDSKLSSFEVMFAREPWEGTTAPPWIQASSSQTNGNVLSKSGIFVGSSSIREQMSSFMKIQKKIRAEAGGNRHQYCRNTKCQTEEIPKCNECKKNTKQMGTMERQMQKLKADLAKTQDRENELKRQLKAVQRQKANNNHRKSHHKQTPQQHQGRRRRQRQHYESSGEEESPMTESEEEEEEADEIPVVMVHDSVSRRRSGGGGRGGRGKAGGGGRGGRGGARARPSPARASPRGDGGGGRSARAGRRTVRRKIVESDSDTPLSQRRLRRVGGGGGGGGRKKRFLHNGPEFIPLELTQKDTKDMKSPHVISQIVTDILSDITGAVASMDDDPVSSETVRVKTEYKLTESYDPFAALIEDEIDESHEDYYHSYRAKVPTDFETMFGRYPSNQTIYYHPDGDLFFPPSFVWCEKMDEYVFQRYKKKQEHDELIWKLNLRRSMAATRARSRRRKARIEITGADEDVLDTLDALIDSVVEEESKDLIPGSSEEEEEEEDIFSKDSPGIDDEDYVQEEELVGAMMMDDDDDDNPGTSSQQSPTMPMRSAAADDDVDGIIGPTIKSPDDDHAAAAAAAENNIDEPAAVDNNYNKGTTNNGGINNAASSPPSSSSTAAPAPPSSTAEHLDQKPSSSSTSALILSSHEEQHDKELNSNNPPSSLLTSHQNINNEVSSTILGNHNTDLNLAAAAAAAVVVSNDNRTDELHTPEPQPPPPHDDNGDASNTINSSSVPIIPAVVTTNNNNGSSSSGNENYGNGDKPPSNSSVQE